MLAELVFMVAVGGNPAWSQDERLSNERILGTRMTTVTVGGEEREVTAQVVLSAVGSAWADVDETREFRTVSVRPENPVSPFKVPSVLGEAYNGQNRDGIMVDMFLTSREYGAPQDIGMFFDEVNRDMSSAVGSGYDVNPNEDIKSGGTTVRVYQQFKRLYSRKFRLAYRYVIDGSTRMDTIKAWSVPNRYIWSANPNPKDTFHPDAQENKDLQSAIGGVTIEPGDSGNRYTLTLPTYNFDNTGMTLGGSKTIGGLQYLQYFNQANGQEKIDNILSDGGIDFNRSLELFNAGVPIGVDMNRMRFPEVEGDPCKMDFDLPAGTLWVPDTPGYQTMTTGDRFQIRVGYDFENLYASTQIAGFDARTMFTMCLNMDLKPPDGSVRYFAFRQTDPVISSLAKITDLSRRKGIIDQARLWIYTDKATPDRLNQRLVPGINLGGYTRALKDVVDVGGFTPAEVIEMGMLKPETVAAEFLGGVASTWATNALAEHAPDQFGEYLRSAPQELIAKATGDDIAQDELVSLASAALNSISPVVREGALKMVNQIQDKSVLKDKVGSLRALIFSEDEEVQAMAFEVLKEVKTEVPQDVLDYLSGAGLTLAVRLDAHRRLVALQAAS